MTFISTSPFSTSLTPNIGPTPGVSASDFAKAAVGYTVNRYAPSIVGAAVQRMDSAVGSIASQIAGNNNTGSGNTGNPSGGKSSGANASTPSANSNSSKQSNGNGGNYGPKGGRRPVSRQDLGVGGSPNVLGIPQVEFESGIESGTINNPLQDTTIDYTPFYSICGHFFPKSGVEDSSFNQLVNTELYYKYRMLVLGKVNYTLGRNFTEDKFKEYIFVLGNALQVYYMIDSILAFTSHSPNNNIAMTRLRMAITPEISNSHVKLKDTLQSTPIPPNMLSFIKHMYQNYSFSNVEGSPIIRLSFEDSLCTSEYSGQLGITGKTYSDIIEGFFSVSETAAVIKAVRPDWIVTLPPSSYQALYDPQFSTFWHNCNISYEDYGSKAIKYSRNTDSYYHPMYYGIFGNKLDGVIYASGSYCLQPNKILELGLWKPFDDFINKKSINSSLLNYSNDKTIRPTTEMNFRSSSMVYAAPYSVVTKDGNLVWEMLNCTYAPAQVPQVHSIENVRQAITRSVGWLLNP